MGPSCARLGPFDSAQGRLARAVRLHTNLNPLQKMPNAYKNVRL